MGISTHKSKAYTILSQLPILPPIFGKKLFLDFTGHLTEQIANKGYRNRRRNNCFQGAS